MLTETHLGAGLPVLLAVRLGEGGAVGIFVHTGLGSGQRSTGSTGNLQAEGPLQVRDQVGALLDHKDTAQGSQFMPLVVSLWPRGPMIDFESWSDHPALEQEGTARASPTPHMPTPLFSLMKPPSPQPVPQEFLISQ